MTIVRYAPAMLLLALLAPAMADEPRLRFEVRAAEGKIEKPVDGRMLVLLGRPGRGEPRKTAGQTGLDATIVVGADAKGFGPGSAVVLDAACATFPIDKLDRLSAGTYDVQAVLHRNRDLLLLNAPGDLYSKARRLRVDPAEGGTIRLELTEEVPAERLPADSEHVRYIKVRSERLGAFHGRPIFLRAAVILPRDFDREPDRKYPLRVHIGGFGQRFSDVPPVEVPGSGFRRAWLADDAPRMLMLVLDGAGPLGDPYQVNSANHGPYGDALTRELIPFVESRFRGLGKPEARVLDGGSTGGWVSLALQVFYPDDFNGCWSSCPDGVDFRSFQLVNIYRDANAYINPHGFERPAARDTSGEVRYTMRHECSLENALGLGDSWALSGGQWGSWNATYGPKGADGRPVPLWDPESGVIDKTIVEHWKNYDLRLVLERDWKALGPRLRGKIHVFVGDADDFFLNNAVHRLDAFLAAADPPFEGSIRYGPGAGHCWIGLPERELLAEMGRRVGAKP
ncbi:MAG TPA: alpha/beta hydrolase-fold protein [Isosphaeraceae bacterium]|jgi:hypothetical protein|nr:alpha/beta hydrolase-fold protein [Isosphaeraceae bacterium]